MFLNCYLISYWEQPLPGKGARDLALAPTQYASTRLASGPAARLHNSILFLHQGSVPRVGWDPGRTEENHTVC